MNNRAISTFTVTLLLVALGLGVPAVGEAQAEPAPAVDEAQPAPAVDEAQPARAVARSRSTGDRPFYLSLGVGPSLGLDAGSSAKLKLQQEAGYHFLPFGDHPGLFAGVTIAQSFIDFTILQFGGRIGADFALLTKDSFRLLVTPSVALGFGMYVVASSVIGTEARSFFNLQLAGDVKVEILDGELALWVRPIGLDFFINGGSLERYDILFGVQLNL